MEPDKKESSQGPCFEFSGKKVQVEVFITNTLALITFAFCLILSS
uniref:Uncharacterized protein n=1 Tax=Uncultured bacterium HF130_AEPn_1 TaxID=663362 RepID=D0E8I1_UNCHF|nr:hypothetical protein ALOHA_HF130_AEPn_1_02 [uncultured bacterium HF130_AEPn_1]